MNKNKYLRNEIIALNRIRKKNSIKFSKIIHLNKWFRCRKCEKYKLRTDSYIGGSYCKICHKQWRKENYQKNKSKVFKTVSKWQKNNPKKHQSYVTNWQRRNRDKVNGYQRKAFHKKYKTDSLFRFKSAIRSRMKEILKATKLKKKSRTTEYIGCSYEELIMYIQLQFRKGMSWGNHGKKWELDHIVPLGLAKTQKDLKKLSHYSNLQPLFIKEHRIKTVRDIKLIKN